VKTKGRSTVGQIKDLSHLLKKNAKQMNEKKKKGGGGSQREDPVETESRSHRQSGGLLDTTAETKGVATDKKRKCHIVGRRRRARGNGFKEVSG